jgi:hypothetical protein
MRRSAIRAVVCAAAAIAATASFGAQPKPAPTRIAIAKHFTPADQVSGRYQYLPFDVPKGTGQLRVTYQYDRANGETVVDLGLFDPGPLDLGTTAFRGYSGGARSEVVINSFSATPGYRPGAPSPGRWHVMLGLYRVGAAGVDVSVSIEATPGAAHAVDYVPARPSPPPGSAKWHLGALHTHTLHSDGTIAPAELMQRFRDKGFDFVAITDHNNTTHTFEAQLYKQSHPLWIVGEEVTTPGGHASVWGLGQRSWIDFRVLPGDPRIRDLVAAARAQGAIFSINHPASDCLACGWTHEIVDGIEAIEISNGRHGEVAEAAAMWDKLLVSGRRITGVGSSDWHGAPNPIDNAHVRVHASSLTQEDILAAIRAGRVMVMTDARAATPDISVRAGDRSVGIGETLSLGGAPRVLVDVKAPAASSGRLVVVSNGQRRDPVAIDSEGRARSEVPGVAGYIRLELVAAGGSPVAFTNPVYLVR